MVEHGRTGPLDLLTWSFSRIAMWAPFFIVLIILYEVVMRYFFAAATLWVNEMSLWVAGGIHADELGLGPDGRMEQAALQQLADRAGEAPLAALPWLRW